MDYPGKAIDDAIVTHVKEDVRWLVTRRSPLLYRDVRDHVSSYIAKGAIVFALREMVEAGELSTHAYGNQTGWYVPKMVARQ